MAGLGLVLDYRQKKLEIESAAGLEKNRQDMYRAVLEKSAGDPGRAADYRQLILSDALHLRVERTGVQPVGQSSPGIRPDLPCLRCAAPGIRSCGDVTHGPSR